MWKTQNNQLTKHFRFKDFNTALDFVNQVGKLADKANHHPDIFLSWGKVMINLTTHDKGGVTEKDVSLSKEIDKIQIS